MEDMKELKIHDFGYGNEIPEFLGFLDKKQSYWKVFTNKLINNCGK